MRIVVLLPKLHAGAELALNQLMRRKDLEIIGLVRSDISPFRRKYWRYVKYGVRKAGVFYGAMIALAAYVPLAGLALAGILIWNRRRKWLSVDELIRRHGLLVHDTEDINARSSRKVLKSWKPDILVTINFDQILQRKALAIPKVASLNVHPGLLPKYRGLWPEFWKLHNREKEAGVTIHHISEAIDAGEIVAQIKYPIQRKDTKLSLMMKSAYHGPKILINTLLKLKRGIRLKPLTFRQKPSYYSLPKKRHFEAFHRRGKRLFSLGQAWRQVVKHF